VSDPSIAGTGGDDGLGVDARALPARPPGSDPAVDRIA